MSEEEKLKSEAAMGCERGDGSVSEKNVSQISEKHFPEWLGLKERIHNTGRVPDVLEREVWWAAVGENVGVEINGKSGRFSRPVLVFKKLSKFGFMAVPLTTQEHDNEFWYVPFEFKGKTSYASLAQARVMSVSRLYGDSVGRLSKADFRKVCEGFVKLYGHLELGAMFVNTKDDKTKK